MIESSRSVSRHRPGHIRAVFAALVLVVTISLAFTAGMVLPAQAVAGPADGWESISATLYDLESGMTPTLVISGLLPQGTTLPAQAALAIPKGSTISWAGELTGDPANDPMLDITIEPQETYDLVVFTVTHSPAAQLELSAPEGFVTGGDAGVGINMSWISGGTAERARVAIASPLSYHLEGVSPEPTVEVRDSDVLYWVESSPVTAGQELVLAGSLVAGPAPEREEQAHAEQTATPPATATAEPISAQAEPEADAPGDNTTWIIIGILVAIIAVVLVILVRRLRESGGSA